MWVNEALKFKYRVELASKQIKIEWMNETAESGLPYDFRISQIGYQPQSNETDFSSCGDTGDLSNERIQIVSFIEVKSTRRDVQESFPISYQELLFAQKFSDKYEIYRVYGAGCDSEAAAAATTNDQQPTRVKIIRNLPHLLNTHGINLFIVI